METVEAMFFFFKIFGLWQPPHWKSKGAIILYNIYGSIIWMSIFTITLSMILYVILKARNVDDLADNFVLMLSFANASYKMTNILLRRKDFLELSRQLSVDPFCARDDAEVRIREDYAKRIKNGVLYYALLLYGCNIVVDLQLLLSAIEGDLQNSSWQPYNMNVPCYFWATYVHHAIGYVAVSGVQIANDSLVISYMLHVCAQLKILNNRIANISSVIEPENSTPEKESNKTKYMKLITDCVHHHWSIIKFSKRINEVFNLVIFIQFQVITLVICSTLYLMASTSIISLQFLMLFTYLAVMFCQIFIYCWFGNEVILESENVGNAVYRLDWTGCNSKQAQNLVILMMRFRSPIIFTSSFLVTLNISSFTSITKMSFSAFNVLQKMRR